MDNQGLPSTSWFMGTKCQPPKLRAHTLKRSRLLDALHAALMRTPVVLLSAHAGSGKTTLLAALPTLCPDLPLVWLTLDEDDNDPIALIHALIATFQRLHPSCGHITHSLLASLPNPRGEVRRLLKVLLNEVIEALPDPFLLVLDDLHVLTDPATQRAWAVLIEYLPPTVHFIGATRYDPPLSLARLRARGLVSEFRLEDMRFTLQEVQQWLTVAVDRSLSRDDLRLIHERTEGWAAGLSLVVTSLQHVSMGEEKATFFTSLAQAKRSMFDFLAEEVLNQQDPSLRMFLLHTSILAELTPILCQRVTGWANAAACLEMIFQRNLFVSAIEQASPSSSAPDRIVYRYHDLFQHFLRTQLQRELPEEQLRDLHRRVGAAETHPVRRIHHYLAAQCWHEAAQAIELIGEYMAQQGALSTLRQWIDGLPHNVREQRPELMYLRGLCAWETFELDTACDWFEQARQGFERAEDAAGLGKTLVYLATSLSTKGNIAEASTITQQALAYPLQPAQRVQLLSGQMWQELASKNWSTANACADEALTVIEVSRDAQALHALLINFHFPLSLLPGGMERTERLCRLAKAHLREQNTPLDATLSSLSCMLHLWRGQWDEARATAERALSISEQLDGLLWIQADVSLILPVLYAFQGNDGQSNHLFDSLFSLLSQPSMAAFAQTWEAAYLFILGRVRWLQGRWDNVRTVAMQLEAARRPTEWTYAPLVRLLMQGLLALIDHCYPQAESLFREAVSMQQDMPDSTVLSDARLLLAHVARIQNHPEEALATLLPVLKEREQQETPGCIMWEGASVVVPLLHLVNAHHLATPCTLQLLTALGEVTRVKALAPATVLIPKTGEWLTPREVEVLRVLTTGASNPAIAEQLVLSVHTVKIHVAHILSKLRVTTRIEAALCAQELGII